MNKAQLDSQAMLNRTYDDRISEHNKRTRRDPFVVGFILGMFFAAVVINAMWILL